MTESGAATDQSQPLTTVLVDDVEEMRALLRSVLARDGRFVVVGEAADGEEAIRVVGATKPDLVVLDIGMPTLDGIAALPGLRDASEDSRIVMLSGFPAEQMAKPAIEGGAVGYIEKGEDVRTLPSHLYELATVLGTVQRVLDAAYSAELSSPRQARADLRAALAAEISPTANEIIQLLTTELVTNAVTHGHGAVTVTAEVSGDRVRIAVGDDSAIVPVPGNASADDEGGRGLALVEGLAARWGVEEVPTGKVVWFETPI
ncbi:MAG TPA: response regulator [Acidimicrobiales bacterium]|nr:response regulator [Acidimicrobiales bacterium]